MYLLCVVQLFFNIQTDHDSADLLKGIGLEAQQCYYIRIKWFAYDLMKFCIAKITLLYLYDDFH